MKRLLGMMLCRWKGHLRGRRAFALPEPENAEINAHLLIIECPRCGARWQRKQRKKAAA